MLNIVMFLLDNGGSHYMKKGKSIHGKDNALSPIVADITSSFTILLAIFFPSVTGKLII